MADSSKCKRLIVAAIDFGTTYSGYAFSSKDDWRKVLSNQWSGGILISQKTPTALLLNRKKEFVAFGYEAEDQYGKLVQDEEHEGYYYFHRFKMAIYKQKTKIPDYTGKELEALVVFRHCIEFLKDELFKQLMYSFPELKMEDLDFVLTVPAIWDDVSKQFMREAAVMSNQGESKLVTLDHDQVNCQVTYLKQAELLQERQNKGLDVQLYSPPRHSSNVIEIIAEKSGTANFTVHQKCDDGTLTEVLPTSGGPWGGKSVDDAFDEFLSEIIGGNEMRSFRQNSLEDYIELFRNFETKKRTVNHVKMDGYRWMSIPISFMYAVKGGRKGLESAIEESCYAGIVSFEKGKFRWKNSDFAKFFDITITNILSHLDRLFSENEVRDVKTILMVEGFSECKLIQDAVKNRYKDKKVVVPEDCGLAVLKGAVYFGHVPDAISRPTTI